MKMNKQKIVAITLASLCCASMVGCDRSADDNKAGRGILNFFDKSEVKYQADTKFMYSLDGGDSWSQTIQEVPINETYYLAVEMQVSQSEETKDEQKVVATITIPQTNVLDCYLDDHPGVSITGKEDAVNKSISYDFDIVAGVSPSKFRVVFECKPLEEGRAKVEVVYDEKVSESWDTTGTIKYVAADGGTTYDSDSADSRETSASTEEKSDD